MKKPKPGTTALPADFPQSLRPYAYKILNYRYWGRDYHLVSSQKLFSATLIDRGSQLLLQSLLPTSSNEGLLQRLLNSSPNQAHSEDIAKGDAKTQSLEIWDWGCGIGTLGIMAQGHCAQMLEKRNKLCQQQGLPSQSLHCELQVFDRDALALAFTEANWQHNIGPQLGFSPSLHIAPGTWGEEGLAPERSDTVQLVLGNIPAKLGEPVLRQILPALAATPDTYVAIVIVAPLRHLLEEATRCGQIEILYQTGSGDHSVFHYRQAVMKDSSVEQTELLRLLPDTLQLYKRGESCFALERRGNAFQLLKTTRPSLKEPGLLGKDAAFPAKWLLRWPFRSAYGLADFDSPSFSLQLLLRLLAQRNWGSRALLWEAGHGHLACFLALKPGSHLQQIDLASRNRISLCFAQHNLRNLANFLPAGHTLPQSRCHHLPSLEAISDSMSTAPDTAEAQSWDLIVVLLENHLPDPGALREWLANLPAQSKLEEGGEQGDGTEDARRQKRQRRWLCVQGRSHVIQQLELQRLDGWIPPKPNSKEELRAHSLLAQLWHYE